MKILRYKILAMVTLVGFLSSCEILEPEDENIYDLEDIKSVMTFTEGFLMNAYRNLPRSHQNFRLSYASDDAVNNDPSSNIKTVVSGGWTSSDNPFSEWNRSYESIFYINTFLENMDDIEWYWRNETTDSLFAMKLKGEAYALRAWNYFHLLQAHAGKGANGEMLGVPIVDAVLNSSSPSEYQVPRSSFNDLVEFIIGDCNTAISLLPDRWSDIDDVVVDQAMGSRNTNRINGIVAKFIKAKTLLYAASPAYSDGTYTYGDAAKAAASVLWANSGLDYVTPSNTVLLDFYNSPVVANYQRNHREVLWYSSRDSDGQSWESENYPPSQYGRGLTNPTQELVNAFPMIDGTPAPLSKINSNDPYSGRDPRLAKYIFYNGSQFQQGDQTITINTQAGSQDAVGSTNNYATKTGYYLKKFMNIENVDLDPTVNSSGMHYYIYVRFSEALLIFAEAANEDAGPDGDISGFSSRQVMNALRARVGITSSDYVDGLDKAGLRELIRNERRIELCFEKQRFWDMRRWMLTGTMNGPVSGVRVSADGNTYTNFEVESRVFAPYQIYGPIPYTETLRYELVQNEGWK